MNIISSTTKLCEPHKSSAEKFRTYEQYYIGNKDEAKRKNGYGENHWIGPESIEWYQGSMIRDTMHGTGDYRWCYRGPDAIFAIYEGNFYANSLHGYGFMSYPDGKVFNGLFHSNLRWGPGVMSHVDLHEDVGLWRGTQLVRIPWRPSAPSIVPDLCLTQLGRSYVEKYRIKLVADFRIIGETNSALDLLKRCGAEPRLAAANWRKLYPKHCTDLDSPLCHIDAFENMYYSGKVHLLQEVEPDQTDGIETGKEISEAIDNKDMFYAWNNNKLTIHMMKHCFKHEEQRKDCGVDIMKILNGPRNSFKPAGKQEIDCRTLLMASYLGHTSVVVKLVNECDIHPDVADVQGNSALMYAVCGNQADIAHFLVEAGANVNCFNDSCCTPLTIALFQYACAGRDVSGKDILHAVLPPSSLPASPPNVVDKRINEWNIIRDISGTFSLNTQASGLENIQNKNNFKTGSNRKIRSVTSIKDAPLSKKPLTLPSVKEQDFDSDDSTSEYKEIYQNIKQEYALRVNEVLFAPSAASSIPYIFDVNNMVTEICLPVEEVKVSTVATTKRIASKVIKETTKPSKDVIVQDNNHKDALVIEGSTEKLISETLAQMLLTILQLLCDGADPNLVTCPQPALVIAIQSGCSNLVQHLINYGANVNEIYHHILAYTPLDIAVSRPFKSENLKIVQILLESGSYARRQLPSPENDNLNHEIMDDKGPTLLHAVIARHVESEIEEQIQSNLIELLLNYNCDYLVQYKGKSAIDFAMIKNPQLFDTFVRNPRVNLNSTINDENQSILSKYFTMHYFKTLDSGIRIQVLTNLMLFGADPLIECQNNEEKFINAFQYSRNILAELENLQKSSNPAGKVEGKGKKEEKPKKDDKSNKLGSKSSAKIVADDLGDYKQAIDLMTDCARLLHIRWLQAKLLKGVLDTVLKFRHRHWIMILKEIKHPRIVGLWLTSARSLEIWDILKTTTKKCYTESTILKKILFITHFANKHSNLDLPYEKLISAKEKDLVEADIHSLTKEHRSTKIMDKSQPWSTPYVKPELDSRFTTKFRICFECALPLTETKITCKVCKLVSFCCEECIKCNLERVNCHPCSTYLIDLFPDSVESEIKIQTS